MEKFNNPLLTPGTGNKKSKSLDGIDKINGIKKEKSFSKNPVNLVNPVHSLFLN